MNLLSLIPGLISLQSQPFIFPTSIFLIFIIYFVSLYNIPSFSKFPLLYYIIPHTFEIVFDLYVIQYINVLGDDLNRRKLLFKVRVQRSGIDTIKYHI